MIHMSLGGCPSSIICKIGLVNIGTHKDFSFFLYLVLNGIENVLPLAVQKGTGVAREHVPAAGAASCRRLPHSLILFIRT